MSAVIHCFAFKKSCALNQFKFINGNFKMSIKSDKHGKKKKMPTSPHLISPHLTLPNLIYPNLRILPEIRRKSSFRTSWRRSVRRRESTPRPSRRTSGRWREAATPPARCWTGSPWWRGSPQSCRRHWKQFFFFFYFQVKYVELLKRGFKSSFWFLFYSGCSVPSQKSLQL